MPRLICLFSLALCCIAFALQAEEIPAIAASKAAQLRRMEPLTAEKVDVFVEAGQLTPGQAAYIKQHINANGQLALPPEAIAPARTVPPPEEARPAAAPARSSGDPYADFHYMLDKNEQARLREAIRDFRHSSHPPIGRELRKAIPQVNALIAAAYSEAIDLPIKIELWEEVAGPKNPDAAIGLFETHRTAMEVARPILIPYVKDAGGAVVHRSVADPDAETMRRTFSSRELRDMIEKIEGLIARCAGPSAAIFLTDVYAKRYHEGEAPMRDTKRERHRLVQACGGDPDKFDEDKPKTWGSSLSARQRALIADHLIPYVDSKDDDRRQIVQNGLKICLPPRSHPAWDAGRYDWEHWWDGYKDKMLGDKNPED